MRGRAVGYLPGCQRGQPRGPKMPVVQLTTSLEWGLKGVHAGKKPAKEQSARCCQG